MYNKTKNILIGAGGTGGHIIPAINIGKNIDCINPIFITGARKIEKLIYSNNDIHPVIMNIKNIRSVYDIILIIINIFMVCNIIRKYKIKIVFIMGSYLTIPIGIAAILMQKPLFLMEQDFIAGKTIKMFSLYAHKIFVGFSTKYRFLPAKKIIVTGHAINHIKLIKNTNKNNKKTILVLGGSQGAKQMTFKLYSILKDITDYHTIIIAGNYYREFQDTQNIKVLPYQDNLSYLYGISDIIISRAGAMSIAEIMYIHKPCIFIPFPKATHNHQLKNVKFIMDKFNIFEILEEKNINKTTLLNKINKLFSKKIKQNVALNGNNAINIIKGELCNV